MPRNQLPLLRRQAGGFISALKSGDEPLSMSILRAAKAEGPEALRRLAWSRDEASGGYPVHLAVKAVGLSLTIRERCCPGPPPPPGPHDCSNPSGPSSLTSPPAAPLSHVFALPQLPRDLRLDFSHGCG